MYILPASHQLTAICSDYKSPGCGNSFFIRTFAVENGEVRLRSDGKHHGNIDIAIAVEHLCLAATEQGLATCWVCNFDAEKCKQLFGIADNEEPAVLIPIGYAADEPKERLQVGAQSAGMKKRKAIEEICII